MGLFDFFKNEKREEPQTETLLKKREEDFSSFHRVTEYIYKKSGIADLEKRKLTTTQLKQCAIKHNIFTTDEFLLELKKNTFFYQEVLNIATVNETFFFREVKELEWLVEYVKKEQRDMKILSLPCSSGEEIYSILIMLESAGVELNSVEITGYDINSNAISNAKDAIYNEHSLHKLEPSLIAKYFSHIEADKYKLLPNIKSHAKFSQKNIFDLTNETKKYDIILSRNMFIYFDDEKRRVATDIIVNLLKNDAIFIKGHADHIYNHKELQMLQYGVYVKEMIESYSF
jgi:chemotaxis protein methyltransferase CheR